ncbi:hypothetical protein JL720_11150 [Aureococcus anophagefferens]|nr:hypothetical protein JL720_11150 [Aureococcus anophagefferens]
MADEDELVAHCRELCLKDADCVAFETAPDGVDFYESEFEGKRYYLDGFDHNGVNCCLEQSRKRRSGDVDGDCPAEVSLWTTRELVEGEAEFCDRDYGLDLGVCTAYAEYDFDDSEDANVARRDLYLERGCAAIVDGFYYFILAMCFLAGALVTFLAAACWIFDALQDQERKSRLRAGTCVVVVASALVWFFGLLPAVYWLPPVYELSYAGAGVGLVFGLAAHAKPVKKRLLPRVDGKTYCVSPAGDVARVEAEMVPAIEAVPIDRSPVVVGGGASSTAPTTRRRRSGRRSRGRSRPPRPSWPSPSSRCGAATADVFISHCKQLPTSEDRAIWLADLFEGEGLKVFFDRSDLLEISEAALRDAVRVSRVIVTVAITPKDAGTEAKDKLLRQVDLARRDATVRGHAALKGLHAAGSATF